MATHVDVPLKRDVTEDTFSQAQNYRQVVFQKSRPVLDSEMNEFQASLWNHLLTWTKDVFGDAFMSGAFKVVACSPAGNDIQIQPGPAMIKGVAAYAPASFKYTDQAFPAGWQRQLLTNGVNAVSGLGTPLGADRNDLVILRVVLTDWDTTDDPGLINADMGVASAIRQKVLFGVSVIEDVAEYPDASNFEDYLDYENENVAFAAPIAWLRRQDGVSQVTDAMIEDIRSQDYENKDLWAKIYDYIVTATFAESRHRGGTKFVPGTNPALMGKVHIEDVHLTDVDGNLLAVTACEQQYPVRRIFARQEVVSTPVSLPSLLTETDASRVFFQKTQDANTAFSRIGVQITTLGSGWTDLMFVIHDDAHAVVASGSLSYASNLNPMGTPIWAYIDLPFTMEVDETYHLHLYCDGFTGGATATIGTNGTWFAHQLMYMPVAGKFGTGDQDDLLNLINALYGNNAVSPRVSGEDDLSPGNDIGDDGYHGLNRIDLMAVDFSNDTYWANWSYEKYIGIDLLTGRVKISPAAALDLRMHYAEFNTLEPLQDSDAKNLMPNGGEGMSVGDQLLELRGHREIIIDANGTPGKDCHYTEIPPELLPNTTYRLADGNYYLTQSIVFRDGSKIVAMNRGKAIVYDNIGGNMFYAVGTAGGITHGTMTAGIESLTASGGLTAAMEQAEWFTRDTAGSLSRPVKGPRIGIVSSPTAASTWGKPADNVDTGTATSMAGFLKNIELSGIVWRPFSDGDYLWANRTDQVVYMSNLINAKIDIQIEAEVPDVVELVVVESAFRSDINIEFIGITLQQEGGRLCTVNYLYETDLTIRARHIAGTFNSTPYINISNAHRCKVVIEEENTDVVTDACATVSVSLCDDSYIRYSGYRVLHADEQFTSLRGCVLDRKSDGRTPNNDNRQATAYAQFTYSENCDVTWIESNKVYVAAAHASDFHTFNQLKNCRVLVQAKDLQTGSWTDGKAVFVFTNIESSEIKVQQHAFEVRDDLFGGDSSQYVVFTDFTNIKSSKISVNGRSYTFTSLALSRYLSATTVSNSDIQLNIDTVSATLGLYTNSSLNGHFVKIESAKSTGVSINGYNFGFNGQASSPSGKQINMVYFLNCQTTESKIALCACSIFGNVGSGGAPNQSNQARWVFDENGIGCAYHIRLKDCQIAIYGSTTWSSGMATYPFWGCVFKTTSTSKIDIGMDACTFYAPSVSVSGSSNDFAYLVSMYSCDALNFNLRMKDCTVTLTQNTATQGAFVLLGAETTSFRAEFQSCSFSRVSTGVLYMMQSFVSQYCRSSILINGGSNNRAVYDSILSDIYVGCVFNGRAYTISGLFNVAANQA